MIKKIKLNRTIGIITLILSLIIIISSSTKFTGFSILSDYSYSPNLLLFGFLLLFFSLILLISGKSQMSLENRVGRRVFNAGIFKESSLNRDTVNIKNYLYAAPIKEGAYLGLKKPGKGEAEVLLEISYSNPLLFVDERSPIGKINQEALWIGRNLKLKKISDKFVKEHGITYRHIVATPTNPNERSVTREEYSDARKAFKERFGKPAQPDYMNKKEWKTFINIIESIKKPSKISARGKK